MPVAPFIKPVIKAAGEALVETKPPLSPPVLANSTRTAIASGKKGALVSRVEDAAVKFAGQTIKKQSFRARMANENLSANELKLVDEFIAGKAPLDPVSVDDFGRFLDGRGDIPRVSYEGQEFRQIREDNIDFGGPVEPKIHYGPNADTGGPQYSSRVLAVDTPEDEIVTHHFDHIEGADTDNYYAHIRSTSAIRTDGKSVTVVHELQSDKHSGGQKYSQVADNDRDILAWQAEFQSNILRDVEGIEKTDAVAYAINEFSVETRINNDSELQREALAEWLLNQQPSLSNKYTKQTLADTIEDSIGDLELHLAHDVEAVFDKDPKVYATLVNRTIVDSIEAGDSELRLRMNPEGLSRSENVQTNIYEGKLQPLYKKAANVMGVPTRVENGYLVLDLSNIKQPKHIKRMAQAAGISTPLLVALQARAEESGEFDMASLAGPILNRALRQTVSPKGGLKNTTDAAIKSGKKAALVSKLEDKAFELSGRTIKAQSFKNQFKGLSAHEQGILDAYLKGRAPLDKVSVDEFIVELTARGDILQRVPAGGIYKNVREGLQPHTSDKYSVDVYTEITPEGEEVTHHFTGAVPGGEIKGYYGHTRQTDITLSTGKKERLIHESQSDKHSQGVKRSETSEDNETEFRFEVSADLNDFLLESNPKLATAIVMNQTESLDNIGRELGSEILSGNPDIDYMADKYAKALQAEDNIESSYDDAKQVITDIIAKYRPLIDLYVTDVEFAKDPKYLNTLANNAVVKAIEDGIPTLKLRVGHATSLGRSPNVQEKIYNANPATIFPERYENLPNGSLASIYMKIGNKLGLKPEVKDGYLTLNLDQVKQTPYIKRIAQIAGISTPLLVALQARADDYPQITEEHLRNLKRLNYSDTEILQFQEYLAEENLSEGNRSNYTTISGIDPVAEAAYSRLPPLTKESFDADNATKINARLDQVYGRGWHTASALGIWTEEHRAELDNVSSVRRQLMTDMGFNFGYDETLDAEVIYDSQGRPWEIDANLWEGIKAAPFEWGLAVVGGVGGFALGGTASVATVVGAPLAPAAAVGGSVVGAAALGGIGAGIDQIINAHALEIHLTTKEIMSKVGDSAVVNGLFDLATIGTGKVLGTAYKKALKPVYTGAHLFIAKNWRRFMKGDLSATNDLVRSIFSPEVIDNLPQLREDYAKFYKTDGATGLDTFGKPYPLSQDELDLRILSDTRPEGVMMAGSIQGQLNVFTRRVADRAKAIQEMSSGLAGPKAMIRAQNELILYRQTVKDIFENVKNFAAHGTNKNGIDYTDYTWDSELAVEPMLLAASKHLDTDRATKQFSSMMANIEDHLETRKFSNLIELRKEIRSFKGNIPKNRVNSHQAVQRALDAIDIEVRRVTEIYMGPEGARTYAIALDTARTTYGQMKALEKNVLYKALTAKDGRTEKTMRAALIRSLGTTDTDGTYDSVLKVVPSSTRHEIEGVAIQVLEGKHTKGDPHGVVGINYPALYDELASHTWTSKDAKAYVAEIESYANVFKADPDLSQLSRVLSTQSGSAYLADSLKARVKYHFLTQTFNKLKETLPTQGAARITLTQALERILPAPMEAVSRGKFIRAHKPSERSGAARQLDKLAADLAQIEFSRTGSTLRLYQATATGQFTKSNGSLGAGFYVRKAVGDPREARRVLAAQVPEGQLAGAKEIDEVFGRKVDPKEYPKLKSIGQRLKKLGFKGILLPDGRGMLFDKP